MRPSSPTFRSKYGPWSLVIGAGAGIGAEFSRQLAAARLNLLLVDHRADLLAELAAGIGGVSGVEVRTLSVDIGSRKAPGRIVELADGLDVGLLIHNAAHSFVGRFLEQPLEDKLRTLSVNCHSLLHLAHAFGQRFAGRGSGGMIFLSSLAGFRGHPLVASYSATKAFSLVLGEALWDELRANGVDVLAVCPGPTRTPGYLASASRLPATFLMEPAAVARGALLALGKGPVWIAGRGNRITEQVMQRLMPRGLATAAMGRLMRVIYPS